MCLKRFASLFNMSVQIVVVPSYWCLVWISIYLIPILLQMWILPKNHFLGYLENYIPTSHNSWRSAAQPFNQNHFNRYRPQTAQDNRMTLDNLNDITFIGYWKCFSFRYLVSTLPTYHIHDIILHFERDQKSKFLEIITLEGVVDDTEFMSLSNETLAWPRQQ